MNLMSCYQEQRIILWDYENKRELNDYTVIDSDSIIQPKNFLTKENLNRLDPYKYYVIKSEGIFSEELTVYKYQKKNPDTIRISRRYEDEKHPPKYEATIRDMKFKEKSNLSRVHRENNIEKLKRCLHPLKNKYQTEKLILDITIHTNGDVLDHKIYRNSEAKVEIGRNEGRSCFVNLGKLINPRTSRTDTNQTLKMIIPI